MTDEHLAWSLRTGNTNPLHLDGGHEGVFGTGPVVAGPLVLAWVAGLASRDISAAAIRDIGIGSGAHPAPVRSGDVLHAASHIDAPCPLCFGRAATATKRRAFLRRCVSGVDCAARVARSGQVGT